MSEEPQLTYKWSGEGHRDYSGWDGQVVFGRVFQVNAGPTKGQWRWAGGHDRRLKYMPVPRCGRAASARKTAASVERHYLAALEMNELEGGKHER